jgi:hypothetical protein
MKFSLNLEYFSLVIWNNYFMVMVDDDDGALSLGGHSLDFVEVYFDILRIFSRMVWYILFVIIICN